MKPQLTFNSLTNARRSRRRRKLFYVKLLVSAFIFTIGITFLLITILAYSSYHNNDSPSPSVSDIQPIAKVLK